MRLRYALICGLCTVGLGVGAAPASAHIVSNIFFSGEYITGIGSTYLDATNQPHPYQFSSDVGGLAINQSNGHVLALDGGATSNGQGIISQFTGSGAPEPFSALGVNTITPVPGYGGAIAVDNSATPSNGNFYVSAPAEQTIRGFNKSGTELGGNFPIPDKGGAGCGIAVDSSDNIWVVDSNDGELVEYNSGGAATGTEIATGLSHPCVLAIDKEGSFYVANEGEVHKVSSEGSFQYALAPGYPLAGLAVDPSNGDVYISYDYGLNVNAYSSSGAFKAELEPGPEPGPYAGIHGGAMAVNGADHSVYLANTYFEYGGGRHHVDIYRPTGELTVPDVTTEAATAGVSTATMHGTVNPDGVETTNCEFEWGSDTVYSGGIIPCSEGNNFSGSSDYQVSGELPALTSGVTYHYRLVASNANGVKSYGADQTFKPQGRPEIVEEGVVGVNTDTAMLEAEIYPGGEETSYHFEFGTDPSYGTVLPEPDAKITTTTKAARVSVVLGEIPATKLQPDTTYHYRVIAENELGSTPGTDQTFRTFAEPEFHNDECANAHVRSQTRASLLDDCRAYELVSAANAGGYDVQSDLVSGQSILSAEPEAGDRLLYSLRFGKVPGIEGSPTNYGLDPYVATRGPEGWSTTYEGLPADATPSTAPFGSPLLATNSSLSTFAFGGQGLCSPCFSDGSIGIPVRLPDGSITQGMAGSLDPGPGATQSGHVGKPLSGDGMHMIFGSAAKFEPEANSNGDTTIYERDLFTATTTVVSKTPAGATMTGSGIAELDVSSDGSHVLIGKAISTDSAGNTYYQPYMYLAASGKSIDLAPSSTSGVLYAGMSADGSRVFFTSADRLTGEDTDNSVDLYEARISGESASLTLISKGTGGAGNSDSCTPSHTAQNVPWNNVSGTDNCDVLAFAGGAGVSSENGTVYFLSPEKLDGQGEAGEPNLFVARPGASPSFVATLEPDNPAIRDARLNSEAHSFADLQTNPDGSVVIFASRRALTGYPTAGHSEIYRYDEARGLECASCAPTRATATGDVSLSSTGSNLSDDGRVFFTSPDQLVLRDTNNQRDAYEWEGGKIQLISTGTDPNPSGLLTVSSDGVDAYFFTRQTIVPTDGNGSAMKIYVARENGGFPYNPPRLPCAASDECHGPGSIAPPPALVGSFRGSGGNVTQKPKAAKCRKGQVSRHGRCVAQKHSARHSHKARHHRGGAGR